MKDRVGPGNYDNGQTSFSYKSYNRQNNAYVGSIMLYVGNRMARFDNTEIRPKLGPGAYNPGYETVK